MLNVNRFRLHNFRHSYSPKLISKIASAIAIVIGGLVLIGWQFNIAIFKTGSGSLTTMKANTAVCFILSGVSLWLHQQGDKRSKKIIAQVCALVVAIVGLLTLSQYWFGWNLGIDQLLFHDSFSVNTITPGRMGVNTALAFLLISSALLLLGQENRRSYWYGQVLALLAAVISFQALIGYAYQVTILYGIAPYITSMALHTALTLMVLSVGVLWVHPNQGFMRVVTSDRPAGLIARRLLIAAIAVPLGLGWLIVQGQRAGHYDPAFAISLFASTIIIIFVVLTWQNAALIDRLNTARDRTEAALRENQEKLRSFVDANIIGILSGDIYGNIHEANDELLRIIDYTREDLNAGRISWINITPPEYLYRDEQGIAEARETGACTPYEKEYISKDGRRVPILVGYALLGEQREESIAFILDLSDRKQLEIERQAANQRIINILESITDNFVALDHDWRIIYVNQETARLNGLKPKEMIGKTHWEQWPWSLGTIVEQKYRQAIATREPTHFEALYEPLNIWLEVHAYPSADGLSVHFRDIT